RDEAVIKQVREQLVSSALGEFVEAMRNLHIPLEDIVLLLEKSYEIADKQEQINEKINKS
ncbi:MAG TPA: hypothetical protein VFF20_10495, partial [Pseudogracilibacillus sp.]|nr:hypothetical protein [Pseudogracilibacillus sp.]